MQKIYVLLRNDQQTGPYSLEEIIQFDLKPYDLIWIQGRSAGWYYPQEIAALHPYLGFLPKKQPPAVEAKPPFVAVPPTAQRTETPKASSADAGYPLQETVRKEAIPSSPAGLEEAVFAQFREKPEKTTVTAATQAAAPAKKKKVPSAVVGLTTILVVGGVFAASWFLNRKESMAAETPVELTAELSAPAEITGAEDNPGEPNATKQHATPVVRKNNNTSTKANRPAAITTDPVSVVSTNSSDNTASETASPPDLESEPPVIQSNEEEKESAGSEGAAPVEKKKKLRDKIFDLFRKKPETPQQEETTPAENTSGERTASRRDESTNLAQMVHVRFTIPNEWMMGIHGAKATLVNRSSETVQKATIEVQYFDDDNQLLQKKIISFEKVGGKASKTISIPDHPTATKVDYSVVSASGKPAA